VKRAGPFATVLMLAALGTLAGPSEAQPAAGGAAPTATPGMRSVEEAIETSALRIDLPTGGVGTATVRPCRDCAPRSLLAGSSTCYFLGSRAVPFAEAQRALAARPRSFVAVFFSPASGELTRLVVLP
jgi:hypothetical protein